MNRKAFRPADLLVVLLATALFFFIPSLRGEEPENSVIVTSGGDTRIEPLAPDRSIAATGPLGETLIEIRGSKARIVESPCPGKQCVRQGWVAGGSGAAVCAPNRVAVEVRGEGGVDATTR